MRKIQLEKRYRKLAIAGVILALLFVAFVAWGATLGKLVITPKTVLLSAYDEDTDAIVALRAPAGGSYYGYLATALYGRDTDDTSRAVIVGNFDANPGLGAPLGITPYLSTAAGSLYRQRVAEVDGFSGLYLPATGTYAYNGASWDRARSSAAGDAQTVGIPASAGYVYNGTSMDRARGAGADALAATGLPIGALYGYNGASWDRVRTSSVPAEIGMLKVVSVAPTYAYKNMYSTDNVVVVKSGAGTLNTITINTSAALETITWTVYDNTSAAGTKIATIYVPESWPNTLQYNVSFTTGLTIQASPLGGGASNITVSYN